MGLTWAGCFVNDGDGFPGTAALTHEMLTWPAFEEIRGDVLLGDFSRAGSHDLKRLEQTVMRFRTAVDLSPFAAVVRAQAPIAEWNSERTLRETPSQWVRAEWGTSA